MGPREMGARRAPAAEKSRAWSFPLDRAKLALLTRRLRGRAAAASHHAALPQGRGAPRGRPWLSEPAD